MVSAIQLYFIKWICFFIFLTIKFSHFRYIEVPSGHHVELTITDFEVISLLFINPPPSSSSRSTSLISDGELLRPALHHLGHLPVWLLVLLQILQRLSVHTGKTPNEETECQHSPIRSQYPHLLARLEPTSGVQWFSKTVFIYFHEFFHLAS